VEAGHEQGKPRTLSTRRRPQAANAHYPVGYCKPPREHCFKPGQSGNPGGRPKGAKNTGTLLRELLDSKIEVRTSHGVRRISVREAILARFAEAALKGDTKSAGFLLQRYDALDVAQAEAESTLPDDQQIIDSYLEVYLKKENAK
jgi:hypothetical protein